MSNSLPRPPADEFAELSEVAWSSLDQLGRALRVQEAELDATLVAILSSAVEVVEGCTAAGINLLVKGKFVPQVVLGAEPAELDALQQRSGVGPCIESSATQTTVELDDAVAEMRWPEFAARAVSLGVRSMLCLPMWVDARQLGSLSLYGRQPAAFAAPSARRLAQLFATHAALALADAQRTEQLRRVIANRDVIGQAKGILMERNRITADDAFARLRTASQSLNRKLVEVAEVVAATGELPGH